jgi:hypothetical protein
MNAAEGTIRFAPVPRFTKLKDVSLFVTWYKGFDDFLPADAGWRKNKRVDIKDESTLYFFEAFCRHSILPDVFAEQFDTLSKSMKPSASASKRKTVPRTPEWEWFRTVWHRSSAATVPNVTSIHTRTVPALALMEWWVTNPAREILLRDAMGHIRTTLFEMLRPYGRVMPCKTGTGTEVRWAFADGLSDWQEPAQVFNIDLDQLEEDRKLADSITSIIQLGHTLENNPLCWVISDAKPNVAALNPAVSTAINSLLKVCKYTCHPF